jgi:hypothetical protein
VEGRVRGLNFLYGRGLLSKGNWKHLCSQSPAFELNRERLEYEAGMLSSVKPGIGTALDDILK